MSVVEEALQALDHIKAVLAGAALADNPEVQTHLEAIASGLRRSEALRVRADQALHDAAKRSYERDSATFAALDALRAAVRPIFHGESAYIPQQVYDLVNLQKWISGIKVLRDHNPGMSLAEAKRIVDHLRENYEKDGRA